MAKTNERVVETLVEGGVTHAFTLPGLGITWSLPAFKAQEDKLKVVLTRSEWIASIMAQVTGKLTGRPAVAMGQGPWMTTIGAIGILEAHFSGSPMVVLTETSDYDGYGQMGVYQTMTGDYGGADAMASLRPITKYCTYATAPAEAVYGVQMAIKHASLPRMGPAAVVMKTPIIRAEMPDPPSPRLYPTRGYQEYTPARPDGAAIDQLARDAGASEAPGDRRRQWRRDDAVGRGAAEARRSRRHCRRHQLQRQGRDRRDVARRRGDARHMGSCLRQPDACRGRH